MIFRISKEKATSWRVAFAYTGRQLEACVLPETIQSPLLGLQRELMVLNTANFVSAKSEPQAMFIAGLLNSLPVRTFVQGFAKPKNFPYLGFNAWHIGILPVPRFDKSNALHLEIAEASREAHKGSLDSEKIDSLASQIYQINAKELACLRDTFNMLRGRANSPTVQSQ